MQKRQRNCIKSDRLHLNGHTQDRNFLIYLGAIILTKRMGRRKRYPSRKKTDSSSFRTMSCEDLIGKTIRFRDRIQCWECDETDPYETCPNIDNPDSCPQKDYAVKVEKVTISRGRGETLYTINEDYEFPAGGLWRAVRLGGKTG